MKYWILYIVCVIIFSATFFRPDRDIPIVEVIPGQILFSIDSSTPGAVVTGYKIPIIEPTNIRYTSPVGPYKSAEPTVAENKDSGPAKEEKPRRVVRTRPPVRARRETPAKPKETPPEKLNPYIMERIIRTASDTRYFSEKSQTKDGVTLEMLSITPRRRKNDYIIKFKITNDTRRHFIPQVMSIRHGDNFVDVQTFLDYIIGAGKTTVGYVWVRAPRRDGANSLRLNESGGGYRKFNISY